MGNTNHKSEIARILQQIQQEYESAVLGVSGLSQGGARHSFITTRMENMGRLQQELEQLVGEDDSIALLVGTLEAAPEPTTSGAIHE